MARYEQLTLEQLCVQCFEIAEWTQETIYGQEHYCRACYTQLGEEPTDEIRQGETDGRNRRTCP